MRGPARICAFLAGLFAVGIAQAANYLPTRGLWVQFEKRGWASGYWPGQVIQEFNDFDPIVGRKVSEEVAAQLDVMRGMGVNTITIELRTADPGNLNTPRVPPICHVNQVLGFQWPQPTPAELTNLAAFFDLVQSKSMRVILSLTNVHMEESPPTNSQTWLGAILGVVKNHPAFDFVVFNGDAHTIDTVGNGILNACGVEAEPPLWLGPGAYAAAYVKWAIGYAMSLGMPASKLSAEATLGDFNTDSQTPAGPSADGSHLWKPIAVLKQIFDSLGIPDNQRVYALSFYQHRKCVGLTIPCVDVDQPTWAEQTLQDVYATIGSGSSARVVAVEMGLLDNTDPKWTTEKALASLLSLMVKYRADGGSFWRWTNVDFGEDADSSKAKPVKIRGAAYNYNTAVKNTVNAYYKPLFASAVFSTTQTSSRSFLRFNNTSTSAGQVNVTLMDDRTGQTLGQWTSPNIPAGVASQHFIGDIE